MKLDPLREMAWIGGPPPAAPPRALVLVHPWLNDIELRTGPRPPEAAWSEAGALVVAPYSGPWNWMNAETLVFLDALVGDVLRAFALPEDFPLISTGCSMGGQGSLLFTALTRHRVVACEALYPVCDLAFHHAERPDTARTLRAAFRREPDYAAALRLHSPLHRVAELPDIPYLVLHGERDEAVSKSAHSDPMVAAMRARGLSVEYAEVEGMGHGGTEPDWVGAKIRDWVIDRILAQGG
jgi:dipeptidyl aminopeptidase/acylaminoacyl peptidase